MRWLAGIPHTRRQVRRPDKHTIDTLGQGDLLQTVRRFQRFHLNDQADLVIRAGMIVLDLSIAPRSCATRHASHACGRIPHRLHGGFRFLGRLHIGHKDRLRAKIQNAFDRRRAVLHHPHNGCRARIGRHRLQRGQHIHYAPCRMFGIDHDPVIANRGKRFRHRVAAQRVPQPDLLLPCFQRGFECVLRQIHHLLPKRLATRRSASR